MHWLLTLDTALLRFINETLSNRVFDVVMPIASGKYVMPFLGPAIAVIAFFLIWKGGVRGRLCTLMLALLIWPGDSFIYNTIKHAVARPRPFVVLSDIRLPGSNGPRTVEPAMAMDRPASKTGDRNPPAHNSMPSSHAANWFAATMILLVYYRRSWRFMLPMACLVSFSRLYNGVHYPSDVLAGAIIGAGYAAAGMWGLNAVWQWTGRKWFPLWWEQLPSLVNVAPVRQSADTEDLPAPHEPVVSESAARHASPDQHWLRLGYILLAVLLIGNLAYIGSGLIELSGDEAYQWVWSKHLALSYYSKPPLIAYTQFVGTHLWGDNEFGVRFFSPVISAVLGFLLLRFFAREVNARAGFFLLLVVTATPLLAIGSILMTIDPLSVLFWTAAMIAGWRAVQPDSRTSAWLWTGLWMGLGFLSKYTELLQWLCWAVFFILWKPARVHLRRPGPYLALLVNAICATPVLIWNQQHGWITVTHVVEGNAQIGAQWHPTLRYFFNFIFQETALLNPVFFIAMVWAAIAFWRRNRHNPRLVYIFSMGAPVFLSYLLFTFHSGVLPNWIAPSVVPLFCVMAIYWDQRWRLTRSRAISLWLGTGLTVGFCMVALLHDTNLVKRIAGRPLPVKPDPLTRVRAYSGMAKTVGEARDKLLAEGKPVFIIGNHYGITSLVTFYLPEAKTNVTVHPLVYAEESDHPVNQYYFWPGYREQRKGENAIYMRELSIPPLVHGWVSRWLSGGTNFWRMEPEDKPAPASITQQFDSVTDLGLFYIHYQKRVYHIIQLFECRDLH